MHRYLWLRKNELLWGFCNDSYISVSTLLHPLYHITLFLDAPQLLLKLIQSPALNNLSISQIASILMNHICQRMTYTLYRGLGTILPVHLLHYNMPLTGPPLLTTHFYTTQSQHIILNYHYFPCMFKGRYAVISFLCLSSISFSHPSFLTSQPSSFLPIYYTQLLLLISVHASVSVQCLV